MDTTLLHRDFGRLEGKLDGLLSEVRELRHGVAKRLEDHETRINRLEEIEDERRGSLRVLRWLWSAIGVIGGLLGGIIGSRLG